MKLNFIKRLIMQKLIELVCSYFNITVNEFWVTRKRSNCDARKIVQLIAHENGMKITEIGILFNQHHSTIIHNLKQSVNFLEIDENFKNAYAYIKSKNVDLTVKSLKKQISTDELKALIELSFKAGQNNEVVKKQNLVKLYCEGLC